VAFASNGDAGLFWRDDGEGPPVLLIMGLGASSLGWYRVLPELAPAYRTIVFDNRGTGRSDPITRLLKMEDLVQDALGVLDAAGEESAHIVGASMGGMIAQQLALHHPERVRSLALCCTTPVSRQPLPPWRLIVGATLRTFLDPRQSAWVMNPALYSQRTRDERPERIEGDMAVRMAHPTPARTAWLQLLAIARHDTRERLSDLATVPVTVIHGEEDVLIPLDRGELLHELIPGSRLAVIPEAGHVLTTDEEEASIAALLDHLEWAVERQTDGESELEAGAA
jgi:pimeloyl-ACP methyl ester carboxylesterase